MSLDPRSLDNGASSDHLPYVSDSAICQAACCGKDDCHLAMMATPADDGTPECFLVNCMKDGNDVCVLQPSNGFKVFRKTPSAAKSGTCAGW